MWGIWNQNLGGADNSPKERIIVNQDNYSTTLGGTIDSSKEYFIDGIINIGLTQIKVPINGIQIRGFSFALSGLISSESNHTMFINEGATCGSVLLQDFFILESGANSSVFSLINNGSGFFINQGLAYNDCTNRGDLFNFQQGLEENVNMIGGNPSITLHGIWDGWKSSNILIRGLSGTISNAMYREGTLFQINSRFIITANIDLGTLGSFIDFQEISFVNPSSFKIEDTIITRDGNIGSEDSNIIPNILESNIKCNWENNIGMGNTFLGIELNNTIITTTPISTQGTLVDLEGSFDQLIPVHFEQVGSGFEVKHLGNDVNEFLVTYDMTLESARNAQLVLTFIKVDSQGGNPEIVSEQLRTVNNLSGSRDVAFFSRTFDVKLSINENLICQVANVTGTQNISLEIDSYFLVIGR
jgi:hypothetical protein